MELKTFFDNFELLADAPNGVPKLREMILQLAVQGKLVPQDPKDEPASVLLEMIKAEKERLIKEGKIKKQKEMSEIVEDEKPFNLPNRWEWARLQKLVFILGDGLHGTPNYTPGSSYYFINGNNLNNGKIEIKPSTKTVSIEEMIKYKKDLSSNAVLVSINGTLGNVAFYNGEKIILGKSACYFNLSELVSRHFLKILLESPYFISYALRNATGSTIRNLPLKAMNNLPVPLPPLNEQKRIVAKVDELMTFCDELESRKQNAATNCIRLNNASLDGLVTATEVNKFNKQWQRICDSFDILYSRPENVVKLRQAILQLAVQGKLVPQDPKDEPASVLLENIKAEKERLVKEGKIRKSEVSPAIKTDEVPYELPGNWEWVRFGSIINIKSGSTIDQQFEIQKIDGSIPYLKVADMNLPGNKKSISTSTRYVKVTKANQKFIIPPNSIIFPKRGGAIATNKKRFVNINIFADSNCMAVNCSGLMSLDYLFCWFKHIDLWKLNSGTSVPQINNKDIEPLLFCLPPIQEQKRIVEKVDELMGFCDRLEAGLSKSQINCNTLMQAAVAEIIW